MNSHRQEKLKVEVNSLASHAAHRILHCKTPTTSPAEEIHSMWRELHGSNDWKDLLDPLHPWLRREIIKYGELAQATYDAFDADDRSPYHGSCRFGRLRLFGKLGLDHIGYEVTKYIYASSPVNRLLHQLSEKWSKDSHWMGYVAVSSDEETRRIGRRDIVVAWRGTKTRNELFQDFKITLESLHGSQEGHNHPAKVERGFRFIYTSKSETSRYNKMSASEQVMEEIRRLVSLYSNKGQTVSLTITGHSLGGALALLNAHEAATANISGLYHISVLSFGAPAVGNDVFERELEELRVKVLRVVSKQDTVPKLHRLKHLVKLLPGMRLEYVHVGVEMKVDAHASPYLRRTYMPVDLEGFHSLETYIHLVDGFLSRTAKFRTEARRDVALVNKSCGLLHKDLRIPECWNMPANKGLVHNAAGRWVLEKRHPDDVPTPDRMTAASAVPPPILPN